MIFDINKDSYEIKRRKGIRLSTIGWKEEDFQKMMYENLDVLLPEDELLSHPIVYELIIDEYNYPINALKLN